MVKSYPTIYVSLDSLEPPPTVSGEEPNTGNSRGAGGDAIRGITGGHAAQSKDWDPSCRGTSRAQPFEALGRRNFVSRNLLKDRREEHQVHLLFIRHLDIFQAVARDTD